MVRAGVSSPSEIRMSLSPREGYDAWAPIYDGDGNPLIAVEGPAVASLLGDLRGLLALDVGCGTGRHALAMAEAGARVVGLDPSAAMLAVARGRLRGRGVILARHALPGALPVADGRFDVAVLGLVAEHLVDLSAALQSIAAALRPGGRLILSNLHPERTAEGQRARYIDPITGERRSISGFHRTVEEHRAAASSAGLSLVRERDLTVPAELEDSLPRAGRYVGLKLGWVGYWRKL